MARRGSFDTSYKRWKKWGFYANVVFLYKNNDNPVVSPLFKKVCIARRVPALFTTIIHRPISQDYRVALRATSNFLF